MKILYHHRIGSKDGQYVHITEMVNAFEALGHEVIMVRPTVIDSHSFGGESRLIVSLKRFLPKALYELLELAYNLVDNQSLRRAIRRHSPDFIYERYNLYFVSGVWAGKKFHLPFLLEINSPLMDERSRYNGLSVKWLARWSERYVWRNADHIFTVTDVLARKVAAELVPRDNISVTPNGIDRQKYMNLPSRATAKRRLGIEDYIVLGFTGFVREWHGLEQVIDLIATRKDIPLHLMLVGDGPARIKLEQHAFNRDVAERVTFTGLIEREDILKYIAAFDVALQPSVVPYASPLKLFEYMAAGCSIVAPDTENIREILSHEVNALLFATEDINALSAQVERLVFEPALRERLGEAARQTINERDLTWIANAESVLAVAHRLLSK